MTIFKEFVEYDNGVRDFISPWVPLSLERTDRASQRTFAPLVRRGALHIRFHVAKEGLWKSKN